MFNNPFHQDIDDESDEIKPPTKVLVDGDSSATDQSVDASNSNELSSLEKFDNQFFNLNKSNITDSALSSSNLIEQLQNSTNNGIQMKKQDSKKKNKEKSNDGKDFMKIMMSKLALYEEKSSKSNSPEHLGARDLVLLKCESGASDQPRANLLDSKDTITETDSSLSLTRDEIIRNPFPLLTAAQQKESEKEFNTDLRGTADFQPKVETRLGVHGGELKTESKDMNPFGITSSNGNENSMRPSGEFGLKSQEQYQESLKQKFTVDLGEIRETQAEYRDSALETQHEEVNAIRMEKQSDVREDNSAVGISKIKMVGMEDVFEADSEDSREFSQIEAPVFANLYYDKDSSVNQSAHKLKDLSSVRDESHHTIENKTQEKITHETRNDTERPIGMSFKPQEKEEVQNHLEAGSNLALKDAEQEIKSANVRRTSLEVRVIDRRSLLSDVGEGRHDFAPGDVEFFNKELDISGIQQLTENELLDLEFDQSFIGGDLLKRVDIRRLTPKTTTNETNGKADTQEVIVKEKGPIETDTSKACQRQASKIARVEGVHYDPSSSKPENQRADEKTAGVEVKTAEKAPLIDRSKLRSEIRERMNEIEKELAARRENLSNINARTQNNPFSQPGANASDDAKKFVDEFFKNSVKGKLFQAGGFSVKPENHTKTVVEMESKQSDVENSMSNKAEDETKGHKGNLPASEQSKEDSGISHKESLNQQGKTTAKVDYQNLKFNECNLEEKEENEVSQIEALDIKVTRKRSGGGSTPSRLLLQDTPNQKDRPQNAASVDRTPQNSLNTAQFSAVAKSEDNAITKGTFEGGNTGNRGNFSGNIPPSQQHRGHNQQIFSASNLTNRVVLPEEVVYDLRPVHSQKKPEDASTAEQISENRSGVSLTKQPLNSVQPPQKPVLKKGASDNTDEYDISENVQPRRVPAPDTKPNRKRTSIKMAPHTDLRTVFGYKIKDDAFYRSSDQKKINMDAFCINCNSFINMDTIDDHALACVKKYGPLTQEKLGEDYFDTLEDNLSPQTLIEEANEKIEIVIVKLSESLRLAGQNDLSAEFRDACKKLIKVARDIVSEDSNFYFISQKMQEFDKLFGVLSSNGKGAKTGVFVYVQRLFVALQQKTEAFEAAFHNETNRIAELQEQLDLYERETLKKKAELEFWQYQSQMLKDIQKLDAKNMKYLRDDLKRNVEVLSQIGSEIESSVDESDDDSVGTTESETPIFSVITRSDQLDREALRRYFYTEAVNIKISLPPNHPGQNYLISDLYDQCMRQNIPKEEYGTFLKRQYNAM